MTNKETIEKLEKAREDVALISWAGVDKNDKYPADRVVENIDQAIAALKAEQPVCKTCGGSGKVPSEYGLTQCSSLPISPFNTKPCPDCQPKDEAIKEAMEAVEQRREGRYKLVYDKPSRTIIAVPNPNYSPDCQQPKAEEFTKEARRQLDIGVNVLDGFLREACDKLDSQEAEIDKLRGITHGDSAIAIIEGLEAELASAKERIEENRWIPADEPPEKIDNWDKKVLVLECDSEIPITMTMAEVFLDEGSDAEYWKLIVLP